MAKLELTYHQAFPEDGDPGWHAGWMLDGRRVHATPMRCNPGEHTGRAASKTSTGASATATAPATSA